MTVIMCLDQRGGMLFNNRRQTLDYEIVDRIIKDGGGKLYISPFSEKYFEGKVCTVISEPLKNSPRDASVFIEDSDILPYIKDIDKIIIYRWSKVYPSDRNCDAEPLKLGFHALGKIKFSTEVHKDTVKEIYKR